MPKNIKAPNPPELQPGRDNETPIFDRAFQLDRERLADENFPEGYSDDFDLNLDLLTEGSPLAHRNRDELDEDDALILDSEERGSLSDETLNYEDEPVSAEEQPHVS